MDGYLYLNAAELRSLANLIDADDVESLQLSRRDSLDELSPTGYLVASVIPTFGVGEPFRVAIGRTGSTVAWGEGSHYGATR